jgi:hypothetical protein
MVREDLYVQCAGSVEVAADLAEELLQAADQYMLEPLKRLCETWPATRWPWSMTCPRISMRRSWVATACCLPWSTMKSWCAPLPLPCTAWPCGLNNKIDV